MADGVTYQTTVATPPDTTKWATMELAHSEGHALRLADSGANTTATTVVAAADSSVTIAAANANRIGLTLLNDTDGIAYVKFGTTASLTDFHVAMNPRSLFEVPFGYRGRIDAIWAAGATRMPTIINDAEDINGAGGDIDVAEPTGLAVDEFMLAFLMNSPASATSPPGNITGFTSIDTFDNTTSGYAVRTTGRVADGTEGPTYASTCPSSSFSSAKLLRIQNASRTSPTHNFGSANSASASTTLTLPSVANSLAGPVLAVAWMTAQSGTIDTTPAGWALYASFSSGFQQIAFKRVAGGASSGAGTATIGASSHWAAEVVLLAPQTGMLISEHT